MELQQLKYFVQTAKLESVSKAAAMLCISQPALSKAIKNLEVDLGFPLFDRTGRRIVLNERGRIFLQGVESSLRDLNEAQQLAEKMAAGVSGKLKVGVFSPQRIILPCIEDFMRAHPQVQIDFEARRIMAPALMMQEFDCLFYMNGDTFSNVHGIPFAEDETGLMVPAHHPLARLKEADLIEFRNDNFVFMTTSTGMFEQSYQLCLDSGFTPRIRAKTTSGMVQMRFVTAHDCVAFSARSDHVRTEKPAGSTATSFIRLKHTLPKQAICVAFPCGIKLSPVARLFRDFALGYLGIPVTDSTLEVFESNE